MPTVQEILDTELPKPTFALRPGENAPLPDEVTLTRSSAAYTLTPQGYYKRISAGKPRPYGPSQGLLLEGAQITNAIDHRHIGSGSWSSIATTSPVDGVEADGNAVQIEDNNTSNTEHSDYSDTVADDSKGHTAVFWLKKDPGNSAYTSFALELFGGTNLQREILVTPDTGAVVETSKNDGTYAVEEKGDSYKITITINNNSSGNTSRLTRVCPVYNTDGTTSMDNSATGSVIVDAPLMFKHANRIIGDPEIRDTYFSTPIISSDLSVYPANITRNGETLTITLPNSGQQNTIFTTGRLWEIEKTTSTEQFFKMVKDILRYDCQFSRHTINCGGKNRMENLKENIRYIISSDRTTYHANHNGETAFGSHDGSMKENDLKICGGKVTYLIESLRHYADLIGQTGRDILAS